MIKKIFHRKTFWIFFFVSFFFLMTCKAPELEKSLSHNLTISEFFKHTITSLDFYYSSQSYSFQQDIEIESVKPTSNLKISSCKSNPELPSGIKLNFDCTLSGAPTEEVSLTSYYITGKTLLFEKTTSIQISVASATSSDTSIQLVYNQTSLVLSNSVPMSTLTPSITGTVDTCTSSPGLPQGLSIDNQCSISGTPTVDQVATTHTITASNTKGGKVSVDLLITVSSTPPSSLTYSGSPFTFTQNSSISTVNPTYSGSITSCSSSPLLPSGLTLSSTCSITGSPTTISTATNYTITASNSYGSTNTSITITVNGQPPASLTYANSPFIFSQNLAISNQTPTYSGTITSCTATTSLPTGLVLSNSDCTLSGTPTATQSATSYTITASNAYGSTTTTIQITVNIQPPTSLSYAPSTVTFTQNALITPMTPTYNGTITSCTSSPGLPGGLSINSSNCQITGTPTSNQSSTSYTITASNSSGSTTTSINITINIEPPSSLTYNSSYTFTQNSAITTITPTYNGTVTSCTSSPALPTGLGINSTNCQITGTPTNIQMSTNYTITASNSSGSTTASFSITVNIAPPSNLTYSSDYTFTQNTAITTVTPTYTGTVTSCSISPSLPTGLAINSTCSISGTPTVSSGSTSYTVTASNSSGSTTASFTITVQIPAPSNLVYGSSKYIFTKTVLVSVTPTVTGTVTNCTISPSLGSVGLSINTTTCEISGTPTGTQSLTTHTVTASNSTGSTTASIQIYVGNRGYLYYSQFSSTNAGSARFSNTSIYSGTLDTFNPTGGSYALAIDTQRDILYVGFSAAGNNFIHVYANASTNDGSAPTRTITITPMDKVSGLALDMSNDRLYAVNLSTTIAGTTTRYIFRIDSASSKNGTLTGGVDYAQISSTALHSSGQSTRRMAYDTTRDMLYICDYGIGNIFVYHNASTMTHGTTIEPNRTITNTGTPAGISIDTTNDRIYVSNYSNNVVNIYDSASTLNGNPASFKTLYTTPIIQGPSGLFYDSVRDRLYISSYTNQNIIMFENASSLNGTYAPDQTFSTSPNAPVDVQIDITR
ncbi:MAG: putative Ig domain-containing protein [Leptospiraceae bacterium]|nr:putative Ig domain-containing protein [Leptospiraceae bacterium]